MNVIFLVSVLIKKILVSVPVTVYVLNVSKINAVQITITEN